MYLAAACPGGQIRKECAQPSNCTMTCSNINKSLDCGGVCIVNGCECPNGTVLDEENMDCVLPSTCPSMSIFMTHTNRLIFCHFISSIGSLF